MYNRFDFITTPIEGLYKIERKPRSDERGFFSRFFCADEFAAIGLTKNIVQINHTLTTQKGSLRGMHYQSPPYCETKIVSCLKGEIFDVAIDIRKKSPTFLHWHYEVLSERNHTSLLIPEGFAHGFQTLSDDCELIYLHTIQHCPSAEGGLNALDPAISIDWPINIAEISEKDNTQPFINPNKFGI